MKISQSLLVLFALTSFMSVNVAAAKKTIVLKDGTDQVIGILRTAKTHKNTTSQDNQLAPNGSASLTKSGDLESQGIQYIIHAAPGSMGSFDKSTEPTIESIRTSIVNSIELADQMKVKKIAIPLIGGGIFLSRLNIAPEILAFEIVEAARSAKSKVQIAFVAYSEQDAKTFQAGYDQSQKMASTKKSEKFSQRSSVVQGSITKFQVHGAQAIVNAANMELQFGAGLSGIIGDASGKAREIDDINAQLIKNYYQK